MSWTFIKARLPWKIVFVLGGGFALAEGGRITGLSHLIADILKRYYYLHPLWASLIICIFVLTLTQVIADLPLANIVLPVIAEVVSII